MTAQHLIGTVTKISNLKTATVTIARHVEHPILRKVRVHPQRVARLRVIDWGMTFVAHPQEY